MHSLGAGQVAGEPIFVPRTAESAEDDGWLLSLVYSAAEHRSRLVVLDARDVESDPVAVAHLRHHVPLGFHGTFTSRVADSRGVTRCSGDRSRPILRLALPAAPG